MSIVVMAVTSQRVDAHARAINKTAALLPFKVKKLLISPTKPTVRFNGEWTTHPIFDEWVFPNSLNNFLTCHLNDFVDTDFSLTVHHDGYALNKSAWTNRFLKFDYIGAPWPARWFKNHPMKWSQVGNGAFCLRSKKWSTVCQTIPAPGRYPEDHWTNTIQLAHFADCKRADVATALQFSVEAPMDDEFPGHTMKDSFGFHNPKWHKRPDLILQ